ncbi:2'-5' RNA ligase family protein [Streptomyces melanogenes]|uniref:2'-5' RNA ligase family protein n=1 Tax=Streptomyces melanogenes TaxID=67326 RepID=A0ABZ1XB10_9ACTN|nr:2'-5' RNA ligase family protein [Streptomyces melanogenes]
MQLTVDSRAFPPSPPQSTTDPAVIAAHDWAAFDAVEKMVDHWERPGWSRDTRAYYWMLTIPEESLLAGHMRQCQQALAPFGFDNIDPDGLHLTLGRIGLVEEVSGDRLDQLAAAAQQTVPERFTLQAIPLTASRGAIRYSVAPWTPILDLYQMLHEVGAHHGLPFRKPAAVFRPHIGIAYSNRALPADGIRAALRPLRELDPVDLAVEQVHLVELRREERAYRWSVARTLHFMPC